MAIHFVNRPRTFAVLLTHGGFLYVASVLASYHDACLRADALKRSNPTLDFVVLEPRRRRPCYDTRRMPTKFLDDSVNLL